MEASTQQAILRLEHIYKSFAGIHALQDVSFELIPGEVHALIGENGAGKSTLVKIITGVYQPNKGKMFFQGRHTHFHTTLSAHQHGIAAIYQDLNLFPDLNIAENIFMGHMPLSPGRKAVDWNLMYQRSEEILQHLGVDLNPRSRVLGLSIAEQQMVEIAKALSVDAKVLLMDEPTSTLTLRETEELFRITRQLKERGTAVIFISHRLEELFEIADRVSVLRDGRYIGTQKTDEITEGELIQMMVGRRLNNLFPKEAAEITEVVLKVENLRKEGLFRDISFELRRGEILGFAGLVGARRTEIARAVFGVEPADGGTIYIEGRDVTIQSPRDAMALGVAYLPEDRQQHGLVLPMDLTNNITLPILERFAKHGWLNQQAERRTAQQFVQSLEVKATGLWQNARELSGGNQQKIVLGKWLATQPKILILDEPTHGIDVGTKSTIHQLMSHLAGEGMAILMISSELPEIIGMSDRILVMHEGRLTAEFQRGEASQEKIMAAAVAR
ncbi:D-xylose ABC transporter ATP-binding protein [candidate division KSB3 bacterium]|uniref:D-xylose ABC transporter ATP-binding protein n=1 Tax=candidate division KSB3 bacterium TaxID=2044937 RepID=A0A2G6E4F1_9BACT|nr:MAG: D-xylose ABC transporter ATP-binding protein [candidate division KSB3 bacterium]PIE29344.1 MAG: D-xylose ABC transporter ATP-binding protein [candidate division KSB3 bacterium]